MKALLIILGVIVMLGGFVNPVAFLIGLIIIVAGSRIGPKPLRPGEFDPRTGARIAEYDRRTGALIIDIHGLSREQDADMQAWLGGYQRVGFADPDGRTSIMKG
jgi:hypothetical protein